MNDSSNPNNTNTGARTLRKGRGAVSNRVGRFESLQREAQDDGWGILDEPLAPLKTTLTKDSARSIISSNQSPDVPFERSINAYRGCEHGCIYCFARPTHAFLGLSPGADFESRLYYKPNAAQLLRDELAKPRYVCKPIAIGTNTDPYQPIERKLSVTRSILQVLAEHNHPVTIVTKSALIERDLDILVPMAHSGLVSVSLSVTTLDHHLARRMEPRASAPTRRVKTLQRLAEAGIPCGVLIAPVIPVLNDHEIERILAAVANVKAKTAGYVLLRLPLEIKELFEEWLRSNFPNKADHVLNRMRDLHEGQLYRSEFGVRQRGSGQYAMLIRQRFELARRRLGLIGDERVLRTDLFRVPRSSAQMALFD